MSKRRRDPPFATLMASAAANNFAKEPIALPAKNCNDLFVKHAWKMAWKPGGKTRKQFEPGGGSGHTDGKFDAFFEEIGVDPTGSTLRFLLYMVPQDDMVLHIDASKHPPVMQRLQQPVQRPSELGPVQSHRVTLNAGEVLCFRGSRLHGVRNLEPSFSFGLHYPDGDDEWVVYGMLSGKKEFVFIETRDELYLHSLGIPVEEAMGSHESLVAVLHRHHNL